MENREAIRKIKFMRDAYQKLIDENVDDGRLVGTDVTGMWKADTPLNEVYREHIDALDLAISALEKQEQANTQNINSTHTSRPNALESLNILEQAKDDKGNVPMSLVRQAFRNVMEQDRWHSVAKEGNPKESGLYIVIDNSKMDGNEPHTRYFNAYGEKAFWSGWRADEVIAWKEITSEPYTEEEA